MSDTIESLRRKIDGAGDLGSVVRTMKALAAANISQYERAVLSLADYYRAVQWGLGACLAAIGTRTAGGGRASNSAPGGSVRAFSGAWKKNRGRIGLIVFGSDQGLVGQFNQVLADFVVSFLEGQAGRQPGGFFGGPAVAGTGDPTIWAVGERMETHLADAGYSTLRVFPVPGSVQAITSLVTRLLVEIEPLERVFLFYNRPLAGAGYEPVSQCVLPVDDVLRDGIGGHWPSGNLPEVIGEGAGTLQALIGEYLFVSMFKACAESLASENASRLMAMQGAEKNIKDLLEALNLSYHHLRQNAIDAELFDVVAGAQAFSGQP